MIEEQLAELPQEEEVVERSLAPNTEEPEPIPSLLDDIEESRPRRSTRQPARYPDYEYLYIQDPHHSKEVERSLHFPEAKKNRWEGSYTRCNRINQDSLDLISAYESGCQGSSEMAVSCRPSCQSLQQTTGPVCKAESGNFDFNSYITFNTANSTAMDAKRIPSESENADIDGATSPDVGPSSPIRTPVSTLLDGKQARVSLVALTPRRLKAAQSKKAKIAKYPKAPGPNPASRRTRWLCAETERLLPIATAKGTCMECGLERSRKRIRQHVVQHFMRAYCPCGYNSASRDSVFSHQQTRRGVPGHGGPEGEIHVADQETYEERANYLKWTSISPFAGCTPVLNPEESRPVGQVSPDRARKAHTESRPVGRSSPDRAKKTHTESRPVGLSSPDRAGRALPRRKAPAKVQRPLKLRLGPIPMFKGYRIPKRQQGASSQEVDVDQVVMDTTRPQTPPPVPERSRDRPHRRSSESRPRSCVVHETQARDHSERPDPMGRTRDREPRRWYTRTGPSLLVVERGGEQYTDNTWSKSDWTKQEDKDVRARRMENDAWSLIQKAEDLRDRAWRLRYGHEE